jgi:hypothetical protein
MRRLALVIISLALVAIAFALPSSAQLFPVGGFGTFSPFGFSTFGYSPYVFSPFGTTYATGTTTTTVTTSAFATVNGVSVPLATPYYSYGLSPFYSPFSSGFGFF